MPTPRPHDLLFDGVPNPTPTPTDAPSPLASARGVFLGVFLGTVFWFAIAAGWVAAC